MSETSDIEARAEKATAGPWEVDVPNSTFIAARATDRTYEYICRVEPSDFSTDDRPREENEANADFIAHARTDIPWLCSRLRALEGEIERLKRVVEVTPEMIYALHDVDPKGDWRHLVQKWTPMVQRMLALAALDGGT